jgi:hypothetical protein
MSITSILGNLKGLCDIALGGPHGYLTRAELMQRTGTTPQKLQEWERRGLLRPYAQVGLDLYRPEQVDVAHWLIREEQIRSRQLLVAVHETVEHG